MHSISVVRPAFLLTTALAAAIALAGCSSTAGAVKTAGPVQIEGVGAVSLNQAAAGLVPEPVATAGTIRFATNAPYEPFIAFASEGVTDKFKGLDYDLSVAVAATLGLKADFQQQPFDGLVPGLQAGKYDAIAGGITDNKERQAVATFVDYSASGTGILVLKDNPGGIAELKSLCGKDVAVQKATKQVTLLAAFSAETCGGAPINVTEYPQNTDAFNAVKAGKAQAFVATKVNLVDIAAKVDGQATVLEDKTAPNGYHATPNGVGFLKSQSKLAAAFQAGLKELMADGTYSKIMKKWGQEPISIKEATIDAAID